MAIGSCRREEHVQFWNGFPMLDSVRQDPQSQRLGFCNRLVSAFAIGHDTGKRGNFRNPPPIIFTLGFNH